MGIKRVPWFAIIALLFCLYFRIASAYLKGPHPRDLQIWSPTGSRETNDREGSCGQSEIQHNVTLKGGILAGYFRKLAQYVAMKLCVELCCEEKGCDVAFMSGRNCYGVQCFSEDQCQSIPAKKSPPEPIFISHVTFKGEGVQKAHEPKNLQCSATRMKVGVTLRGGLKAGNFTDVGKVDNMIICTKLCCVAEKCDLAMMINQSCFLVACYTMQLCQVIKAISNKYQPSVAYVMRRTGELQSETVTKLQALHTSDSKLMCKNSQLFYNSTLRGGYRAGNFTDLGKVANMSACVRLCCGDKNCDAAFMLETNCYAVTCLEEDLCTPVHAKKSGALISLNPKISYITSRSEEVMSKNIISEDGSCHAGVISYDVTLRGGMSAGNFTPHGKVGSMEACIEKCCKHSACNAAMMLKDACFTVACYKDELCEKKPIPTSSSYNPKIAYVFREKKKPSKKAKKPISTFMQRLKDLGEPPLTPHLAPKHYLKHDNNTTKVMNHYKSHKIYKNPNHRSYNSTERLTQLLNETSYTEEEMRQVSSNNLVHLVPPVIPEIGKPKSLPEMVNSIMIDSDSGSKLDIIGPESRNAKMKSGNSTTLSFGISPSYLSKAKSTISDSASRGAVNSSDSVISDTVISDSQTPIADSSKTKSLVSQSMPHVASDHNGDSMIASLKKPVIHSSQANSLNSMSRNVLKHSDSLVHDYGKTIAELSRKISMISDSTTRGTITNNNNVMNPDSEKTIADLSRKISMISDSMERGTIDNNNNAVNSDSEKTVADLSRKISMISDSSSRGTANDNYNSIMQDSRKTIADLNRKISMISDSTSLDRTAINNVDDPHSEASGISSFHLNKTKSAISDSKSLNAKDHFSESRLNSSEKATVDLLKSNSVITGSMPDAVNISLSSKLDNRTTKLVVIAKSNESSINMPIDSDHHRTIQTEASPSADPFLALVMDDSRLNGSSNSQQSLVPTNPVKQNFTFSVKPSRKLPVMPLMLGPHLPGPALPGSIKQSDSPSNKPSSDVPLMPEADLPGRALPSSTKPSSPPSNKLSSDVPVMPGPNLPSPAPPGSIKPSDNPSNKPSTKLPATQLLPGTNLPRVVPSGTIKSTAKPSSKPSAHTPAMPGPGLPESAPTASIKPSTIPSRKPPADVPAIPLMPGPSLIGDDAGCTNSETIKNVTLRGGITAGRFKDRGKMADFRQCLKVCCLAKSCDLAFMLHDNCFSVECQSEELCEAVPARAASISPPIMAYIYARSTPVTKRFAEADKGSTVAREKRNNNFHVVKRTIHVLKDNNPGLTLKKRNAPDGWTDHWTIPKLRLKIPNR